MITLYQFPISHFCEKVRWALDYKGLDYRIINLLPGAHIKLIKGMAKKSEVPVIKHDGKTVQGSSAIISYLDQVYPKRLLTPTNPTQQQMALEWEAYVDRSIGPQVRAYFYYYLLDMPDVVIPLLVQGQPWHKKLLFRLMFRKVRRSMRSFMNLNEDTAKRSLKEIRLALRGLSERLSTSPFLAGDYFTRADLAAASLLAPFVQPEKYGLNWPDTLPHELLQTSELLKPELEWVARLYQDYR